MGYLHVAVGLFALALLGSAPAIAAIDIEAGKSASRVTLKLNASGEQLAFDSLSAAFQKLYAEHGSVGFHATQVLDYATYGKKEKLVDAERAYFLVNATKAKGARDEFKVVAFADRKAATAAQKK